MLVGWLFFFFKQKTAYEMRSSDWSSDVCSSDLKIRTLDEGIARVVRARGVNPKWIRGVMRHGYKGAFEMAATVDYLFAFAATADCVADHHFDAVFDAYVADDAVRQFMLDSNPAAARAVAERLHAAPERGLLRHRPTAASRRPPAPPPRKQ